MRTLLNRRRHREPGLRDRAVAWQCASLLLGYPDSGLLERRPLLRQATATLPAALGDPLTRFLDHLDATAPAALTADYVATFDHRKRCCLFLTYYTFGDTRNRGMALLTLKQTYRAHGMHLNDDELPDHLSVVLEFAATGDPEEGRRIMVENRAGLELLRRALTEAASPWAHVLDAVAATLPPPRPGDHDAAARLAAQGPPDEQVGAYGQSQGQGKGPVFLPDPRPRGARQ